MLDGDWHRFRFETLPQSAVSRGRIAYAFVAFFLPKFQKFRGIYRRWHENFSLRSVCVS